MNAPGTDRESGTDMPVSVPPGTAGIELEFVQIDTAGVKGPGEDAAEMTTVLGRRSRVLLGAPRFGDYLDELAADGIAPPPEITRLAAQGHAFSRVSPSLALLPHPHCELRHVSFGIRFTALGPDSAPAAEGRALVTQVRPEMEADTESYNRTTTVTEEVSGPGPAAGLGLTARLARETVVERAVNRQVPHVYGSGTGTVEAAWALRATEQHELAGDVLGLEAIVQHPAGTRLTGRFTIAAEIAVRTGPDRWLTRFFRARRLDGSLNQDYPLSV